MPTSSVQNFADPREFQASFKAAKTLFSAPGKYQSELTRINMRQLWMHRVAKSLPFVAQVVAPTSRISAHFLTDADQKPIWQNGMEVPPGVIVITSTGLISV